ncbi:13537_t:CDS:1, partial [Dentiscutata erythropus]
SSKSSHTVKEESKWTESISVRNNSIIFNIKERINVLYNIAIDEQIIFYKDVILDNSKRVRDLTIGPNDTFYMIRRAKVPRETSQETSKELHTCSNEGTVKVILPNRELEISVSSNDTVAVLEQKIFEKAGMDMSRKTITDGKACGYDKIYLKIVFRNKVISGSNRTLISWGIYPRGHDANYSVFNILFGMIKLGGG